VKNRLGEWRRRRNDAWRRRHGSCDHGNNWHARGRGCPKIVLAIALLAASCAPSGGNHVAVVRGSTSSTSVPTGDLLDSAASLSDVRATTSTRPIPPRASRSKTTVRPRAAVPQPAPRPAVVSIVGDVQQAICGAFRAACQWALRVARCESGFNPRATNGSHRGLFQISIRWHAARIARMGFTLDQMWEVGPNIAVALAIHEEQGGGPWQCK
jgi:hypothetical protein